MKKLLVTVMVAITIFFISGCGIKKYNIKPIIGNEIQKICVVNNTSVFSQFYPLLEKEFSYYGIELRPFNNTGFIDEYPKEVTDVCDYYMTYNANHKWDFIMYCYYIELHLYQDKKEIGSVIWMHKYGAGKNKWDATELKIRKILVKLLPQNSYIIEPPK